MRYKFSHHYYYYYYKVESDLQCAYVSDQFQFIFLFQHTTLSNDDCQVEKRKDYQNCSVLYCVRQLCTVIRTHEQFLKMSVGLGLGLR